MVSMRTAAITLAMAGSALSMAACTSMYERGPRAPMARQASAPIGEVRDLGQLVYAATRAMTDRAGPLAKDQPIVVATMVSIDDFNKSSTFGRLASQLIANKLEQSGFQVRDMTYMRALVVRPGTGELVLSEDATRISASNRAQAVVAGTYAVAGREIYLNIRMLGADTGQIIASADVVIPLDHNTETLVTAMN